MKTPLLAAMATATVLAAVLSSQASANGCLPSAYDPATNTYTLSTAAQLQRFGQGGCDFTATVRMANDIDLTGTGEFTPIGSQGNAFTGTFDGGGHSITGLQVTAAGSNDFGLIGYAEDATIRNVSVRGTVLDAGHVGGGLLVGNARNTTISGITVNGTVRAMTGAGGIAGILASGSLSDSSASVVVTADSGGAGGVAGAAFVTADGLARIARVHSDGSVTADLQQAGGIAGSVSGAVLTSSSSTAWVRGFEAGGLVGRSDNEGVEASIADSFSNGTVMGAPGAQAVGGIVGATCTERPTSLIRNYFAGALQPNGARSGGIVGDSFFCPSSFGAPATIQGNLWNSDTAGPAGAVSGVGTGKTSAQMKELATYTALGWSIVNGWEPAGSSTWGICPQVNDGYPFLQGQTASTACKAPTATPSAATPPALQATVLPSRRRVVSGQAIRIGIRARNTGGTAAASVVSCVRLPPRLVLVRAPGAVRSGRVACFQLGTVAAGAQATRTITARAVSLRRATVTIAGSARATGLNRVAAAPVTVTVTPRAARARVTG